MSHDGCIEVAWKGKAFPYLMHHSGFHSSENYGSARARSHGEAQAHGHGHSDGHGHGYGHSAPKRQADGESVFTAGTGTWNGPAPRGAGGAPTHADMNLPTGSASSSDPDYMLLPSGAKMPMMGLGTAYGMKGESVRSALQCGYRHFDCAHVYANEAEVGAELAAFMAAGGCTREELFVTTKLWNTCHKPADVRPACEASLKALGLTYIDMYLIHWPLAWAAGSTIEKPVAEDVPLQQTWAAMEELVDAGLVRHIGVSNFTLKQIEDLLASCRIKPAVNQVELHPFLALRKLVGVCLRKGVQCVAYGPLGGPSVFTPNDLMNDATVLEVAKETGKTPAQVLLKWNLQRGVPVIPKASSTPRQKENFDGMFSWRLTYQQKAKLDRLDQGKHFCTFHWAEQLWAHFEEGGPVKPSSTY